LFKSDYLRARACAVCALNYFSVVYYFIYYFFVRGKEAKEEEKILHSTFDTLNPIQERKFSPRPFVARKKRG